MITGLVGLSQSGKSEVARILREERGAEIVSFADPIKDLLVEMDPIIDLDLEATLTQSRLGGESPLDVVERTKNERHYLTRGHLQRLGVGARKILGEDVWVDAWSRKVGEMDADIHVVVPDVRFINEVRALNKFSADAVVWGVRRPGLTAGDHESEKLGRLVQEGVPVSAGSWCSSGIAKRSVFKHSTITPAPWWADTVIHNDGSLDDLRAEVLEQFDRAAEGQWT